MYGLKMGKSGRKTCRACLAGMLSAVLAWTAGFSVPGSLAMAAGEAGLPEPVAVYGFEDGIGEGTQMIVDGGTGKEYEGEAAYGEGHESPRSIRLGDYGLKLNRRNLGENYSISGWVRPQENIPNNTPVFFMGYHEPEKWVAVAGKGGASQCKTWTHDGDGYKWKEVNTLELPADAWTQLTLTQEGQTVTTYVNGKKAGTESGASALVGENQDIYLGVNQFPNDKAFQGWMDDVKVYDKALTEEQVKAQYDGPAEEEIFEREGFTANASLSLLQGATGSIRVTLPDGVENAEISYESDHAEIASVSAEGMVTAVSVGNADISIRVKVGDVIKTGITKVEVRKPSGTVNQSLAVEYRMEGAADGMLYDMSGHENHGTIYHPETVAFYKDNGRDVLDIQSADSYIGLPMGIMDALADKEQFTIEITYSRSSGAGGNSWLFCFGSIPKAAGTNNLFYCPYFSFGNGEVRAGIKDDSTEKLINTGIRNQNDTYYTADMVVQNGRISLYLDGIQVGNTLDSGFSIAQDVVGRGTADGILGYIGKSCWTGDTNFVGKVAAFKIYNKALSEEEVQASNPEYQANLQKKLEEGIRIESLLGNANTSPDEVRYHLSLPTVLDEMDVEWSSSDASAITVDGRVWNGTADRQVTLTAKIVSGRLTAEKKFSFTVKPLNRAELDALLSQAEQLGGSQYLSEASAKALQRVVEQAGKLSNQTEVSACQKELQRAMERLEYKEEYKNPFPFLRENCPKGAVKLEEKKSLRLFTLPAFLKDMVKLSYESNMPAVASYSDGVLKAHKAGTATVTTVITAKSDGYAVRYRTKVTVSRKQALDLSGVKVRAAKSKLAKGSSTTVSAVLPEAVKAASPKVAYQAKGAVSVTAKGKVQAKKAGKGIVAVTITAGGKSIRREVTIQVGEISGKSSVKAGKKIALKVKGLSGKVKWSVKESARAKINSKGQLTGKKKGKVTVVAKVSGVQMKKSVRIQ